MLPDHLGLEGPGVNGSLTIEIGEDQGTLLIQQSNIEGRLVAHQALEQRLRGCPQRPSDETGIGKSSLQSRAWGMTGT
jgi:hypothetical protein